MPRFRLAVFTCLLTAATGLAADNLRVLATGIDGFAPGQQLEQWLKQESYRLIARRTEAFEKLKSVADCRAWQEERRTFLLQQIGGLPERTPLHPQLVGTLEGKGYRIEKILFASRPGLHVTANLYLPATPPPWPAVIIPAGHNHEGKAAPGTQRLAILLARNGMAALAYDPVGQGERYQMLDFAGTHTHFLDTGGRTAVPHPNVQYLCTVEHTQMSLGCALLGANIAQYRIWDGMRAIDYLQGRPDVRPDKIGCAGQSGGGTLTAYLMALDPRIAAAAPICYLTTFRRVIDSRSGPQDGEQNIFGQIAFGLDEADYLNIRAPLPTLICQGTREITFDIRGTWELFREAKRFYSRLGYAERVEIHEADAPHGMTIYQREAAARWMHRWLLSADKPIREVETRPDPLTDQEERLLSTAEWTPEKLQCTPRGQVLFLPGEKSVFQINAGLAAGLREPRTAKWAGLSTPARRQLIRETLGLGPGDAPAAPSPETVGRIERDGTVIHKLSLPVATGLRIPAMVFVPAGASGETTLYLHGAGMTADAASGGPIESLLRQGQIVFAAELRGLGETAPGPDRPDWANGRLGPGLREFLLAYLIGKSLVGLRTEDVLHWTRAAHAFQPKDAPKAIHLVAQGIAALPALHAAALEPDAFASVTLHQMVSSWEDMVATPEPVVAADVVHGALRHYTLDDLVAAAGRGKVRLVQPKNLPRPRTD